MKIPSPPSKPIEISTVDGFQGREKLCILLTLTRSNDKNSIGFLKEIRRLNVAITRAKSHLFVVCDGSTIKRGENGLLGDFIEFLEENCDRKVSGDEFEFGEDFSERFREIRERDVEVVHELAKQSLQKPEEPTTRKTDKEGTIINPKIERQVQSALDQLNNFINSQHKLEIKFQAQPVTRAKIHDFCDNFNRRKENKDDEIKLAHHSYDCEKSNCRILVVKKILPKIAVEEISSNFIENGNVDSKFETLTVEDTPKIVEETESEKSKPNPTTSTHPICPFCNKPIPAENMQLHMIHCERIQKRLKIENERIKQEQDKIKLGLSAKSSPKKASQGKTNKTAKANKNSKSKSQSKPPKRGTMDNLDDIMNYLDDENNNVPKPKGETLVQQIIREGSNKPVPKIPQSRSRDINKQRLQNKLTSQLKEMGDERKTKKRGSGKK